jgi:hypothetical protein
VRHWNHNSTGYVDALVEVLRSCGRKALKYVEQRRVSTGVEEMGRLPVGVDGWKKSVC